MVEIVGVKSWRDVADEYPSLKKEAVLFNRVAIPSYDHLLTVIGKDDEISEYAIRELEWLREEGIVLTPKSYPHENILFSSDEYNKEVFSDEAELDELEGMVSLKDSEIGQSDRWDTLLNIALAHELRVISIQLRLLESVEAHPILSSLSQLNENTTATKSDVMRITLNTLPEPDASTPWEQILEYRSDPDSIGKFLDLKNWMNEVVRGKLTPNEVEQKLDYLMSQYQRHMAIHKMKTNTGTFETVIVSGAEFAENLVKFKWGKIAKGLFSLKHRRIALMEGELTAPGSELAYVIKAKEHFSQ